MKKNVFVLCMAVCMTMPSQAGLFDFFSTTVSGVKNLVTSGGRTCTTCGTPYNVRCMLKDGTPGDFVPFPINSCFAPFDGGCRPTPELMERARQHCSSLGQILNEHTASKEENKRGLANSEVRSVTKTVNGLLPAATAIGGMAVGVVTHDGAVAEAGLNASASLASSQNDAKSMKNDATALKLKKEKWQMKNAPQSQMNQQTLPMRQNPPTMQTPPMTQTPPTMQTPPMRLNSMVSNPNNVRQMQDSVSLKS